MKNSQIYIVLIGVMLLWGVNVSALKVLVDHFAPITITAVRIFTAASMVFIILFSMKKIRLPHREEWGLVIGGAFTSVVAHHYFLSDGLGKTSAANGGLILGLGPLLTAVLSVIILKEKLTIWRLSGFLLGGIGVGFTVLAGSGGLGEVSIGDMEILLAILSQAFSFIIIKKASEKMDARLLTGYMLLIGSLFLLLIALWKEPNGITSLRTGSISIWLIFLFSALFATAIGHMVYNSMIQKIGAGLFLGEKLLPAHFIGLIFIVLGVSLGSGALEYYMRSMRKMGTEDKGVE